MRTSSSRKRGETCGRCWASTSRPSYHLRQNPVFASEVAFVFGASRETIRHGPLRAPHPDGIIPPIEECPRRRERGNIICFRATRNRLFARANSARGILRHIVGWNNGLTDAKPRRCWW